MYGYESGTSRRVSTKELMLSNCGLEKTLESPLDCKEIQPVNPKGNQLCIFIGRIDAEAPILWPPEAKSWSVGKDLDAGKDWGQTKKGVTEDEMTGWHHRLNGHDCEQTLGDGEGQGSLACCSPWHREELDIIERLNKNVKKKTKYLTCFFLCKWTGICTSIFHWKSRGRL